jgi:hypothetical protein
VVRGIKTPGLGSVDPPGLGNSTEPTYVVQRNATTWYQDSSAAESMSFCLTSNTADFRVTKALLFDLTVPPNDINTGTAKGN